MARRNKTSGPNMSTLDAWDHHLALAGAELVAARLALITALSPLVDKCYVEIAEGGSTSIGYRSTVSPEPETGVAPLTEQFLAALAEARSNELERGITMVGPHRDEMLLELTSGPGGPESAVNRMPARGYASHGESWSYALALRLASYDLLRSDGSDGGEPVLILDDVFAELDTKRRRRLAERVPARIRCSSPRRWTTTSRRSCAASEVRGRRGGGDRRVNPQPVDDGAGEPSNAAKPEDSGMDLARAALAAARARGRDGGAAGRLERRPPPHRGLRPTLGFRSRRTRSPAAVRGDPAADRGPRLDRARRPSAA